MKFMLKNATAYDCVYELEKEISDIKKGKKKMDSKTNSLHIKVKTFRSETKGKIADLQTKLEKAESVLREFYGLK